MKKQIEIDVTPKDIAKILSEMDTREMSEVFKEWDNIIKENYEKSINSGKMNFWHNLGDCLVWVAGHSDDDPDLHDCIRAMYASSISTLGICDFEQVYKP